MGRSSKPTRLLVDPALLEWTELRLLESQGHTVSTTTIFSEWDLILGPNCWRMNEDLRPYLLSLTLPEARKQAEIRKLHGIQ